MHAHECAHGVWECCSYRIMKYKMSLHFFSFAHLWVVERHFVLRGEVIESCLIRSLATCSFYQVLWGWSNRGREGQNIGQEKMRMRTKYYSESVKRIDKVGYVSAPLERIFFVKLFMFLVSAKQVLKIPRDNLHFVITS